jgi:D-methionine transport system substrate-binding protein
MPKLLTAILMVFLSWGVALAQDSHETLVVGTVAGSDVDILHKAAEVAAQDGLIVTIKEFSDYAQLNPALAAGEIELNSFQHIPYLSEFLADHKLDLVSIGTTYVAPMGFFSKKIKSLDELKAGDVVVIPNDPSNGGRALLLLAKAGKITLRDGVSITPTPLDIVSNPLNLKIVEVDAAQTPISLEDATIAAINNNYAHPFGLNPYKDSIYLEDANSPYVNIIVARGAEKNNPKFLKFVKAYQSQAVAEFILEKFEGATIPAFPFQKPNSGQ